MPTKIVVPELGESIVEATVGRWEKQVGDTVAVGDVLVTLETDKVDVDVGAEKSGVLSQIEAEEGMDVEIGDTLGVIEEDGAGEQEPEQTEEAQAAEEPEGSTAASDKEGQAEPRQPSAEEAEQLTPVARRMAAEQDVDLSQIDGSGPGGRITKQDIETHLATRQPEADGSATVERSVEEESAPSETEETRPTGSPAEGRARPEERVRLTRRRRTIAQRLVEAQQTAAMLTTFNDVNMSAVIEIRKRHRQSFQEQHDVKLGFMSFFVKAAVGALKAFPHLNAEIDGDEMVLKHYYDIGMAIGAEEGLVVPVIRHADRLSFGAIEQTIQDFVERVNDGSLSLEDLRGGTFTITNGGVYGSLLSTPILNPPQVGILGLHRIEERPVAQDGEVLVQPMMYMALSYDHRIVDGREAVQFLGKIKELIEDPEKLLLEG